MSSEPVTAKAPCELLFENVLLHHSFIFQIALGITKNFHDAEDVCQEVLLRVARNIEKFQQRAALKTWLFIIVRNTACNSIRRRIAHPEISLESFSSEAFIDQRLGDVSARLDLSGDLDSAAKALNQRERNAFFLRHYDGLTFPQIGRTLKTSSANAKLIVWRATHKFRKRLNRRVTIDQTKR